MQLLKILFLSLACLISGCVSMPADPISKEITVDELSNHVKFLSQRGMKGRRPRSWESATARKYISQRMKAIGLKPWGGCQGYEQSFGLGTNMIGLLPGSDSELSKEIVVLSCHYDHFGKVKGKIYHGAGDNASGVAAVLEIAEQLSRQPKPPKRTICFAFFDAEEPGLIGSFAFSLREDFREPFNNSQIVSAVNIDMLGRNLFDVVDDSLCVVGAEKFPILRQRILSEGFGKKLTLLPVGFDLVGPRGDYLAFENIASPNLFFTCGVYCDYHKPTDTAEKLDYFKMKRSTQTILETVRYLADTREPEEPQSAENSYRDELIALDHILNKIDLNYEKAGIDKEQNEKLQTIAAEAKTLLTTEELTDGRRRKFAAKTITALIPVLAVSEEGLEEQGENLIRLYEMCIPYKDSLINGYRGMIEKILSDKMGMLFGKKQFMFAAHVFTEEDMSFRPSDNGNSQLDILLTQMEFGFDIDGLIVRKGNVTFSLSSMLLACSGDIDELTDYCLLWWGERKYQNKELYEATWVEIFEKVTGMDASPGYENCLQQRLDAGGFASKKAWIKAMLDTDNYDLLRLVIAYTVKQHGQLACARAAEIISDREFRDDIRAQAIKSVNSGSPRKLLLAVAEVVDDDTRFSLIKYCPCIEDNYALSDHPALRGMKEELEKIEKQNLDNTISSLAINKLCEITGKNLGRNKGGWQMLIDKIRFK